MPDVEMTAICDLREDRMNITAEKYAIDARFTDYKVMLRAMDLDAVYVIMGPSLLKPVVTSSLGKGKDVFIEKPPGTESKQTERWAKLAQENGCKTMVGF
jgi:predicted dehydrogenase